jgi:hypothetical protein
VHGSSALICGDTGTLDHEWPLGPQGNGSFMIANSNSGLVLGVSAASTVNGAQALQWDDNGTADCLWTLTR